MQSSWLLKKGVLFDLRCWWSCSTEILMIVAAELHACCTLFIISAPTGLSVSITTHNLIFSSGF